MSSWKECRLGDVAKFSYGTMPKKEKLDTGIYPTFSGYKYQYLYPEINCKKNDVIVVARGVGGTGDVKIVREDCYLTNLSIKIDLNNLIVDNKFFYYNYFLETLRYLDSGSAQSQITITDLSNEYISLPPLEEQKAIAEILSSLDDKIDLLHRQNQTLESLAQTLFRQWFIEEAKEEWEIGKLPDEFDFTMGLSPSGSTYNEEQNGMPMFQGNADFEFRFPSNRVYTTDPKRIAERFDTLISVRAPVGAQNMAKEKCCIGRGVASFRYKFDNSFYTYTYYKMHSLMEEIKQFNETGTVFGSIGKSDFEAIEIAKPPFEYVAKFQNEVKSIDDKIILNCEQIKSLENLRDTLLLKLLSGEIKIKD